MALFSRVWIFLMWRSRLCEQREDEEHENDEHGKSDPEADDDGVFVRLQSLKRHRLVVVIIFILPDVVTATRAGSALVVEVGHFSPLLRTFFAQISESLQLYFSFFLFPRILVTVARRH